MQVRVAEAADREAVHQLLGLVWTDDYVSHCWDEWVLQPDAGIPLVALDESGVVGVSYVRLCNAEEAWLQALRVHPDARRKGVGSALAQASLTHAGARGRKVARLLIDADNNASATMTERAGFTQTLRFIKLQTDKLRSGGKALKQPTPDQIPALLQLARDSGLKYWNSDWETRYLNRAALENGMTNGCLRILADDQLTALADVTTYDEEYDVSQPTGDTQAVLTLVHGLETEALTMGKRKLDIFLPIDSPLVTALVEQAGYQLLADDGYTIWEFTL